MLVLCRDTLKLSPKNEATTYCDLVDDFIAIILIPIRFRYYLLCKEFD